RWTLTPSELRPSGPLGPYVVVVTPPTFSCGRCRGDHKRDGLATTGGRAGSGAWRGWCARLDALWSRTPPPPLIWAHAPGTPCGPLAAVAGTHGTGRLLKVNQWNRPSRTGSGACPGAP